MTFNKIIWKMAKKDYKKYLFYYSSNSFAVMLFFIFASLYFNDDVVQAKESESIQYVLTVPGVALLVFTVFFISYAHRIFIKKRKREFGLLMTLGMSNREIVKLLMLENGFIAFISIVSGVSGGVLFSRLFFELLVRLVDIQRVTFHVNGKMFSYSILIFLAAFIFSVGQSLYSFLKQSLVINLTEDRITESSQLKSPLIGLFGFVVIVGSIIGLYITYANPVIGGDLLFVWTLSTFMGLYMCIYQFISFFIEFARKNPNYYTRRLLFLTNMEYKFKKLTSVLMLVTVMIMVTMMYSTIILFTYQSAREEVVVKNPYDIAFMQTQDKNNITEDQLYSIVSQENNNLEEHLKIPIFTYYDQQVYEGWTNAYHFMAVDDFNRLISKEVVLKDDEFYYYIIGDPKVMVGSEYYRDNAFPLIEEEYNLQDVLVGNALNMLGNIQSITIMNASQIEKVKNNLSGFESTIHLMNLTNWKDSADVVANLDEALSVHNEKLPPIYSEWLDWTSEDYLFQTVSKIGDDQRNKNSNGLLFFVTIVLSVIFFFASFVLFYLNLFSDIEKEKERFEKLYCIGVTPKEMRGIVSQEMTALFLIPTMTATAISLLFIIAMATDVGGIIQNPEIFICFLIIAVIYHVIQFGFYLFAKRKMFRSLLGTHGDRDIV